MSSSAARVEALAVHGLAAGLALLIYTAGTAFVMTHGSLWLGAGQSSRRAGN
jgi:hypothetical protein